MLRDFGEELVTSSEPATMTTGLSQRAARVTDPPISFLMHKALAQPELISLAAGFVDQETLPAEPTRAAIEAVLSSPDRARAALQYGSTPGDPVLRSTLLERFLAGDGVQQAPVTLDQVVVTAGSNQLLHLLAETLLDPGDIVLCAAPSYFVFLGALEGLGARPVGVATDEQGIVPEALEQELQRYKAAGELERVKAIYVVSYFDNPAGITHSAARRQAIVEIARRWSGKNRRIYVLEDMAYRDLRYEGEDVPSMRAFDPDGDTVVVTHTFSKSYSPGLRVGYGLLPPALVGPVCNQKGNIDFGSPNFNQHVIAALLELGLFEPHVARLRESYRAKRDAMLQAADAFLQPIPGVRWIHPLGGLYVWLELPEEIETGPSGTLFDLALSEGTIYVPGEYCYPPQPGPAPKNRIRLSFGVQSCERIRLGVEALARAIRQVIDA